MIFLLPFLELLILFLLSRSLLTRISWFFQRFTKKQSWVYYLLAFLFLPGTYIHELSHFVVARALFVKTFHFTIWPKIEKHDIKLGSVEIAKSDFMRRFLIGAAPFYIGSLILVGSMYALVLNGWQKNWLAIVIESFLMFEIGNTMFMSKRDLEGSWKMGIFIGIIGTLLYVVDFNFGAIPGALGTFHTTFEHVSVYLGVPIAIDILLIILLSLFV